MPKKQQSETPEEQSAKFRAKVERLIAAGELSPTDADERFETLLTRIRPHDPREDWRVRPAPPLMHPESA